MLLHATRCPTAVIGEIHDNAFYMYKRPFRHAPAHGTRPLPMPPLPPLQPPYNALPVWGCVVCSV